MRNGLDYLQYQQYERALKFLRDAEAREKELSAAERQELKRGIERAQNGLRAAADAATPYALSDRSRPGIGFTPARPEAQTALAARTGSTSSPAAPAVGTGEGTDPDAGAVANLNASRTGADDAPGEPIRLASNEPDAGAPTQTGGPDTQTVQGQTEVPVPDAGPPADPQSAKAEIPALAAPDIPSLTAVPPSTDAAGGARTRPTTTQADTSAPAAAPAVGAPATSTVQDPPAQDPPATATGTMAPAPIPAEAAPAPILLETPGSATNPSEPATTPGSATAPPLSSPDASAPPLSSPDASAPAPAPASDPAATAASAPAPDTGGLVPTAANGPAAPAVDSGSTAPEPAPAAAMSPSPAAGDPDTAPLPPLGTDAARAAETSGPPHRESEEPAGAEAPGATSPGLAGGPEPNPTSTPGVDELPPLPGDLGRAGGAAGASPAQPPASSAADTAATPAPAPTASSEDTTKAEPTRPAVAPEAQPEAPAGPTSTPAVEESLPPLPDALAAGSPLGTALAPAPEATTTPAGEPGSAAPDGPAASAPAAAANGAAASPAPVNDAVGSAGAASAADERPIPVPQPDAATPAETAPGSAPSAAPAGAPAPSAVATDGPAPTRMSGSPEASFFPAPRDKPRSRLSPDQDRRVAELMARQERDDIIRNQAQARPQPEGVLPREGSTSNLQTQTQYDISRAPSPAEARPIKAIPVPEDWVPLAARNWSPQRKYWAAAATCHLPLYFQDAALERYGHSVEQFVGPAGRYLSYPVDDPKQSTQRNQIIQPFFSWGLFCLQIASWPYNAIMDPPWEAQYDLGYYRPGDMVPIDVYWLPLHGYGPPLRGNSY
jgi:hypothetical protein